MEDNRKNSWKPGSSFREAWVRCPDVSGSHRMAYTEWGDQDNTRVLVCVHGLTRNGRDFDRLAAVMAKDYRVVCPDVVGRGKSSWLADPAGYGIPQYASDILVLLARLGVEQVDWLGTSMGGLIGMALAALEDTPVRRMVLNDVGPVITRASLQRIAAYVGLEKSWDSFEVAEAYLKVIGASFGNLSQEQWRCLSQHTFIQGSDGRWRFSYDPGIARPFKAEYLKEDVDSWSQYEKIQCPVLAIRGAVSDLLTREDWLAMAQRGPRASLLEIPEVGHAPMLLSDFEIEAVAGYLLQGEV